MKHNNELTISNGLQYGKLNCQIKTPIMLVLINEYPNIKITFSRIYDIIQYFNEMFFKLFCFLLTMFPIKYIKEKFNTFFPSESVLSPKDVPI